MNNKVRGCDGDDFWKMLMSINVEVRPKKVRGMYNVGTIC